MYVTVNQRWETIMGRGYDKLGTRGGICKPLKYQCTKEQVGIHSGSNQVKPAENKFT